MQCDVIVICITDEPFEIIKYFKNMFLNACMNKLKQINAYWHHMIMKYEL